MIHDKGKLQSESMSRQTDEPAAEALGRSLGQRGRSPKKRPAFGVVRTWRSVLKGPFFLIESYQIETYGVFLRMARTRN